MKNYFPEPIVAQASVSLQHIESQNWTQSQAELTKSFDRLRSLPFGTDFVQICKEARRTGLTPSAYKQQFNDWKRGSSPVQLALLPSEAIAPEAELPVLGIKPVPPELAIAPNRFYITVSQGSQGWDYPIQFHLHELQRVLPKLSKLDWRLDEDGTPIEARSIHATVEHLMGGAR
ncbi:hypothetical protein H6F90_29685 [Trichocoleus sp. FACHB-591]|uniref:hypothetical protein n=1 Tax=Trichocoleus sp. FACHB-591 TaxID=2692872 RepID=UPI0016840DBC|nr:hypothetical protein [Trichocoleus sp. FACHB-591]MBD2099238.1 hypothetical protein [Trichocoleus sp. FACHB-591]